MQQIQAQSQVGEKIANQAHPRAGLPLGPVTLQRARVRSDQVLKARLTLRGAASGYGGSTGGVETLGSAVHGGVCAGAILELMARGAVASRRPERFPRQKTPGRRAMGLCLGFPRTSGGHGRQDDLHDARA